MSLHILLSNLTHYWRISNLSNTSSAKIRWRGYILYIRIPSCVYRKFFNLYSIWYVTISTPATQSVYVSGCMTSKRNIKHSYQCVDQHILPDYYWDWHVGYQIQWCFCVPLPGHSLPIIVSFSSCQRWLDANGNLGPRQWETAIHIDIDQLTTSSRVWKLIFLPHSDMQRLSECDKLEACSTLNSLLKTRVIKGKIIRHSCASCYRFIRGKGDLLIKLIIALFNIDFHGNCSRRLRKFHISWQMFICLIRKYNPPATGILDGMIWVLLLIARRQKQLR